MLDFEPMLICKSSDKIVAELSPIVGLKNLGSTIVVNPGDKMLDDILLCLA